MRIGLYIRGISEKIGGARQSIELMSRALIDAVSTEDELYIFHNLKEKFFNSDKTNVREVLLKSRNKILCDFIEAPIVLNSYNLDVIWYSKNVIPFGIKNKKIVTVLDLAYFLPKYNAYPLLDTIYMRLMIKSSCKRADKIIAISQNTKKDIEELIGVDKKSVDVVYLAAAEKYNSKYSKNEIKNFREKYGLTFPFILYTGSISPRKNLKRLVEAYEMIASKIAYKLVITGGKGWKNKEILKLLDRNENIVRLGFVEDDEMPLLYNCADMYIYPSLYEGFGLPVLEAQACRCPVICSNSSSMPEIAAESVLYIDPYSTADIAKKILKLSTDKKLISDIIKRGTMNEERFSWKESSKKLLKIIKSI